MRSTITGLRAPRLFCPLGCRRGLWSLVLVLAGFAVAACEAGPKAGVGVDARQFQDVVVPAGLRLQDRGHESHSREESGWRQGHFVYTGTTELEEAVRYVRQRMPQHNWGLVQEDSEKGGGVRMRFERDIYAAEYSFSRAGGVTRMVVDYTTDYGRR